MVEAIVYPDMKDSELMEFFDCLDVTDMPVKMFTSEEYGEVARMVNKVLGLTDDIEDEDDKEDIEIAKN
jgi:hypothetical protein